MQFPTNLPPVRQGTTDQTQHTAKREAPHLAGKTDDQKARISNLIRSSNISFSGDGHIGLKIERGGQRIDLRSYQLVKPADEALDKLMKGNIKENFTINVDKNGDFEIGKDGGAGAGHLNNLGFFLHESHKNTINQGGGNVRFSEGLSDIEIGVIKKLLENRTIYLLNDSQLNKLQQIVNNSRIVNEATSDPQKDVQKSSTGTGIVDAQTVEKPIQSNTDRLGKVVDKVEKKVTASSMFKIELMQEEKARAKEHQEEAIENKKTIERKAYLKNETVIDERVANRNKE